MKKKRSKKSSTGGKTPTQLSLEYLRNEGYYADVVEYYNVFAKKRKDLFGFVDIFAFNDKHVLFVQTTSRTNVSARKNKILASDIPPYWLSRTRKICIHGWDKRDGTYRVRIVNILKKDLK